jgi:penicillin-insensitive murein endopeptidase
MVRTTTWLALVLMLGCAPVSRGTRAPDAPPLLAAARAGQAIAMASSDLPPATKAEGEEQRVAANGDEAAPASDDGPIEDDVERSEADVAADAQAPQHWLDDPRLAVSDEELKRKLGEDLDALGSLSIGQASAGLLFGGVRMPEGPHWVSISPGLDWGTEETVAYLEAAIDEVHEQRPGGHPLQIGHISAKRGGHLSPHKSHQSGRDVDISYFYGTPANQLWYRRANANNLDLVRTWAFVRALVTETDVEYIFINSSIQQLIKKHALSVGEEPEWVDSIFQVGSRHPRPIVRHAPGHDTHIHVRFYNPIAQELGRRAHPVLVAQRKLPAPRQYIKHKVRKGQLLGSLAKRYGTTVQAIQRANGLRNTHIRAGKTYLIPKKGKAQVSAPARVAIPARRLPPARGSSRKASVADPR